VEEEIGGGRYAAIDCKRLELAATRTGLQLIAIAKNAVDCIGEKLLPVCSQLQIGKVPDAERGGEDRRYALSPQSRFVMSEEAMRHFLGQS
jgi:hypothetical protein